MRLFLLLRMIPQIPRKRKTFSTKKSVCIKEFFNSSHRRILFVSVCHFAVFCCKNRASVCLVCRMTGAERGRGFLDWIRPTALVIPARGARRLRLLVGRCPTPCKVYSPLTSAGSLPPAPRASLNCFSSLLDVELCTADFHMVDVGGVNVLVKRAVVINIDGFTAARR